MSLHYRMNPGVMFLMAGMLSFSVSQAQAQSSNVTSLLGESVLTLPGETAKSDTDNQDLNFTGDLNLGDCDLLGSSAVTTLSHAHSGFNAGWLLGGTLGLAAGVAGLSSIGGSGAAATILRTPAVLPEPVASIGSGNATVGDINTGAGVISTPLPAAPAPINSGTVSANGLPGGSISGPGNFTPLADTPEPGSLAMFGGMGIAFTIGVLRRRKR